MRLFMRGVVTLVAFALAGCGFRSSPADALTFQAPSGWQSSPGIMGFMQFWRPPADDQQILMLFKSPKPLSTNDVLSNTGVNSTLKGATVEQRQDITICGRQPATYYVARGTSSRGGAEDRVEMVVTNVAGASYFAMYVRPVTTPPNQMAQAALRELCAKS
jgi:hypothetical protein